MRRLERPRHRLQRSAGRRPVPEQTRGGDGPAEGIVELRAADRLRQPRGEETGPRAHSLAPGEPSEVSSTSGTLAKRGAALMTRAVCSPSIPGISWSRRMSPNGSSSGFASSLARASAPEAATSGRHSQERSVSRRIVAVRLLVVDDQHAEPGELGGRDVRLAAPLAEGHLEPEGAPRARAALQADPPAHQVDEAPADRQPEPGAAVSRGCSRPRSA